MTFALGQHSIDKLVGVNQRLQQIVQIAAGKLAALPTPIYIAVVQGNRTLDQQMRIYGEGRTAQECRTAGVPESYALPGEKVVTWTLHSNHIGGNAIDVCAMVNGALEWDDDGELGLWPQIAAAMHAAADEVGVPLYWGGDWLDKRKDRPHFSLVRG